MPVVRNKASEVFWLLRWACCNRSPAYRLKKAVYVLFISQPISVSLVWPFMHTSMFSLKVSNSLSKETAVKYLTFLLAFPVIFCRFSSGKQSPQQRSSPVTDHAPRPRPTSSQPKFARKLILHQGLNDWFFLWGSETIQYIMSGWRRSYVKSYKSLQRYLERLGLRLKIRWSVKVKGRRLYNDIAITLMLEGLIIAAAWTPIKKNICMRYSYMFIYDVQCTKPQSKSSKFNLHGHTGMQN